MSTQTQTPPTQTAQAETNPPPSQAESSSVERQPPPAAPSSSEAISQEQKPSSEEQKSEESKMPKVTHILFDCDNTLVLSEDLAFEACAEVMNRVLEAHGIPNRYTGPQLIKDFVGMNFRGMLRALAKKYNLNITPEEEEKYVKEEEDQVIATLLEKAQPCEGCSPELHKLYEEGKYGLAVVSSSALRRVEASVKKVGHDVYFPRGHVFSAATSLPEPTSKPDPAIYIHALEMLEKKPEECVAVEDSKSGTLSAVRAGIPVMGYVGSYIPEKQEEMKRALLEVGAKTVMTDWSEFREKLSEFEKDDSGKL
ncbi:HAD-like domain-containing protein [Sphaerosporella brunnea]|uniref:HAD-like domain-containing protein n=1 Tax=Sphaerosporella brunnea TaxID=1250544 RepID=A0A5J5F900_9PEZI|nr:HAD-like domain-containing protein [Sphaerosporella brunnea]